MPFRLLAFFITCLLFNNSIQAQKVNWTWMGGEPILQQVHYGTKGVADDQNTPGNVIGSYSWTDDNGDFWMYGHGIVNPDYSKNVVWQLRETQWVWVAGDTLSTGSSVKGKKGLGDPKNTPGLQHGAAHAHHNGLFYFFGGQGHIAPDPQYSNDLWVWDGKEWTWLQGSERSTVRNAGVYGIKNIASSENIPPSRQNATLWVDAEGNVWLFGGYKHSVFYHDLWKWDGTNWTWVSGGKGAGVKGIYGTKGQPDIKNRPSARWGADGWTDSLGQLFLFGGFGKAGSADKGNLNDLWRWDGTSWAWIKGDSIINGSGHYGQKLITQANDHPKSRAGHHCWRDKYGRIWLFGGSDNLGGDLNDLWVWDGINWTWMHGSASAGHLPKYGTKGVEDAKNEPGSRLAGRCWTDSNGDLWLYGGYVYNGVHSTPRSDLWRLRQEPYSKMVVTGNGKIIEEQDLTPEWADNTDFGSLSISNVPIKRTFRIENKGTETFTLWEDPVVVNGGSQHFKVVHQPVKMEVGPGKSVSFTIAFDPGVIGRHNTSVIVNSKDRTEPYIYAITGMGTASNINLIDTVTCSTARLFIKQRNVEHYTVLVSDRGKTEFPVDSGKFNYSPYYLRAPLINKYARIVFQGSENTLDIRELVSGKSYQVVVVPGNGKDGNNTYFKDSSSILYFSTPASKWQDSIQITPSIDSGICETDTLLFEGTSPFPIQWNDGSTINERRLLTSGEYYFLSLDSEQCWMSSDSVYFAAFSLPTFDSISVTPRQPWCEGDTLNLEAYASHGVVWDTGGDDIILQVSESGTYSATSTSFPGCSASGSIDIKLNPKPNAHFLADVFESFGDEIELSYFSDGADIQWLYDDQAFDDESELKIKEDGDIRLWATSAEGCQQMDTAEVIRREVVLRAIPNAFSPNDDGTNDVWFFLHENDTGLLTVFNRWGGVMYQGVPQWNGKIFEEPVPSGIYFYHYRTEEEGKEEVLSSKVQVIR